MKDEYIDVAIPFGQHRGELIADCPISYLKWLLDQNWFNKKFKDLKALIDKELKYRDDFGITE